MTHVSHYANSPLANRLANFHRWRRCTIWPMAGLSVFVGMLSFNFNFVDGFAFVYLEIWPMERLRVRALTIMTFHGLTALNSCCE